MPRQLELIVLYEARLAVWTRRASSLEQVRQRKAQPNRLEPLGRVERARTVRKFREQGKVPLDQKVVNIAERARAEPPRQEVELASLDVLREV